MIVVLLFLSLFSLHQAQAVEIPKNIDELSLEEVQSLFAVLENEHQNETSSLWQLKFQKALLFKKKQGDPDVFCQNMKDLAQTPQFPLYQLALIYSYESCPYQEEPHFNPEAFPKWLKLRLAQSFYERGQSFKKDKSFFKAVKYLGHRSPLKDDRISYLKQALSLARNKKQKKLLKRALYREAPYLNPNPPFRSYLSVAHGFRRNRAFKKSIYFYRKLLNSGKSNFNEKNSSFKWLVWIYKNQGNHKKHIVATTQWSRWLLRENTKQSLSHYYRNQLNLVKSHWNFDENKKALKMLDKIIKNPKSFIIKDQAYWLRGLIYEQQNNFNQSLKDWNQALILLTQSKKNQNLLENILWKKAWLLRTQKKYRRSLAVLHRLHNTTKNIYTKYKALFWLGETYSDLNYLFLSTKTFKKLIKEDIFGYYGLLAQYRINNHLNLTIDRTKLHQYSQNKPPHELIRWLILFDEQELLSRFLNDQTRNFLSATKRTKKDWLNMISTYVSAKNYIRVFRSLENMSTETKRYFLTHHVDLLFPLDYEKEIDIAHKKWSRVPKPLIYSIIRQESAFNKRARSLADAFGLMQIIPSTAKQTAQNIKLDYKGFRQLYDPYVNILLGTAHLNYLFKKYKDHFIFITSAYNAGSTPVNRWIKTLHSKKPFEFIENIPYEETRTYVRLLIRNYIFYHNILKNKDLKYPHWIFKLHVLSLLNKKLVK